MAKILLVIFLLSITSNAQGDALADEQARESLRNLPKFYVQIEDLNEKEKATGITKSTLQTDIEVELRKAGISIFNIDKQPINTPYLYLRYHQVGLAWSLQLQLNQEVSLPHSNLKLYAATWYRSTLGTSTNARFIRQHNKDLITNFINDYLSVNLGQWPQISKHR